MDAALIHEIMKDAFSDFLDICGSNGINSENDDQYPRVRAALLLAAALTRKGADKASALDTYKKAIDS
jgi:hypothetical protein